ncbi:uncharacterized protein FTJAE_8503 [Fusarium tjaetaba]|uniref:Uncharacterized protein n=1 Tax=Fusarium tjaetaba TaxID=1567544 RepID=A0A8H5RAD1_9HYPO|nr:uncharacterized protein FTJAE_8503 [Fusarium tjaetaba]KAF5629622.1 hypothetical protein FTJAE_8503 [Fusarium tjaetaba]
MAGNRRSSNSDVGSRSGASGAAGPKLDTVPAPWDGHLKPRAPKHALAGAAKEFLGNKKIALNYHKERGTVIIVQPPCPFCRVEIAISLQAEVDSTDGTVRFMASDAMHLYPKTRVKKNEKKASVRDATDHEGPSWDKSQMTIDPAAHPLFGFTCLRGIPNSSSVVEASPITGLPHAERNTLEERLSDLGLLAVKDKYEILIRCLNW